MNKKNYILIIILIFTFNLNARSVFKYGFNAKDVALSGSMVSVYNDGFNAFSNPALLSNIKTSEWGASYFIMSLDRSIQTFSYSMPIPPSAGISLSFVRVGVDDIKLTDYDNNPLDVYDYWEGYGMMSFAVKSNKILFGSNLKLYINELKDSKLEDYPAKGLGADIGFQYIHNKQLNIGLVCNDIVSQYKWGETSNKIEEEITPTQKVGFLYYHPKNINISGQLDFNDFEYDRFRLGLEYNLVNLSKPFAVRFGMKEYNDNEIDFLYYLGFGLKLPISKKRVLGLDYALDLGMMGEGMSHIFSFSLIN